MAAPALDVVIVTFDCRPLVVDCLRTLQAHPATGGTNVIVVDNASRDGSADAAEEAAPDAKVIRLDRNTGFAHATNLGIRVGCAEWVLALNPDTRLVPDAIDKLLDVGRTHPSVAVVGPSLVREDGTFDHAARRAFPTIAGALGHFTGLGRRRRTLGALAQYRAPDVKGGPVDAVNGAFMLMRRAAIEQVGLFDEGYWLYMEDLDLCYRLRERGWSTWYEPSVEVVHLKGGSSGRFRSARTNIAFHSGMLRFYRSHYARRRRRPVNAVVYAGIAMKLAASLAYSAVRRGIARG